MLKKLEKIEKSRGTSENQQDFIEQLAKIEHGKRSYQQDESDKEESNYNPPEEIINIQQQNIPQKNYEQHPSQKQKFEEEKKKQLIQERKQKLRKKLDKLTKRFERAKSQASSQSISKSGTSQEYRKKLESDQDKYTYKQLSIPEAAEIQERLQYTDEEEQNLQPKFYQQAQKDKTDQHQQKEQQNEGRDLFKFQIEMEAEEIFTEAERKRIQALVNNQKKEQKKMEKERKQNVRDTNQSPNTQILHDPSPKTLQNSSPFGIPSHILYQHNEKEGQEQNASQRSSGNLEQNEKMEQAQDIKKWLEEQKQSMLKEQQEKQSLFEKEILTRQKDYLKKMEENAENILNSQRQMLQQVGQNFLKVIETKMSNVQNIYQANSERIVKELQKIDSPPMPATSRSSTHSLTELSAISTKSDKKGNEILMQENYVISEEEVDIADLIQSQRQQAKTPSSVELQIQDEQLSEQEFKSEYSSHTSSLVEEFGAFPNPLQQDHNNEEGEEKTGSDQKAEESKQWSQQYSQLPTIEELTSKETKTYSTKQSDVLNQQKDKSNQQQKELAGNKAGKQKQAAQKVKKIEEITEEKLSDYEQELDFENSQESNSFIKQKQDLKLQKFQEVEDLSEIKQNMSSEQSPLDFYKDSEKMGNFKMQPEFNIDNISPFNKQKNEEIKIKNDFQLDNESEEQEISEIKHQEKQQKGAKVDKNKETVQQQKVRMQEQQKQQKQQFLDLEDESEESIKGISKAFSDQQIRDKFLKAELVKDIQQFEQDNEGDYQEEEYEIQEQSDYSEEEIQNQREDERIFSESSSQQDSDYENQKLREFNKQLQNQQEEQLDYEDSDEEQQKLLQKELNQHFKYFENIDEQSKKQGKQQKEEVQIEVEKNEEGDEEEEGEGEGEEEEEEGEGEGEEGKEGQEFQLSSQDIQKQSEDDSNESDQQIENEEEIFDFLMQTQLITPYDEYNLQCNICRNVYRSISKIMRHLHYNHERQLIQATNQYEMQQSSEENFDNQGQRTSESDPFYNMPKAKSSPEYPKADSFEKNAQQVKEDPPYYDNTDEMNIKDISQGIQLTEESVNQIAQEFNKSFEYITTGVDTVEQQNQDKLAQQQIIQEQQEKSSSHQNEAEESGEEYLNTEEIEQLQQNIQQEFKQEESQEGYQKSQEKYSYEESFQEVEEESFEIEEKKKQEVKENQEGSPQKEEFEDIEESQEVFNKQQKDWYKIEDSQQSSQEKQVSQKSQDSQTPQKESQEDIAEEQRIKALDYKKQLELDKQQYLQFKQQQEILEKQKLQEKESIEDLSDFQEVEIEKSQSFEESQEQQIVSNIKQPEPVQEVIQKIDSQKKSPQEGDNYEEDFEDISASEEKIRKQMQSETQENTQDVENKEKQQQQIPPLDLQKNGENQEEQLIDQKQHQQQIHHIGTGEEEPSSNRSYSDQLAQQISDEIFGEMVEEAIQCMSVGGQTEVIRRQGEQVADQLFQELFDETLFIANQLIQPMVPLKLVRTSTEGIAEYINELLQVVQQRYVGSFMANLNTPLYRDPLELLANLQNTEIGGFTDPLDYAIPHAPNVLDVDWYLQLEKERESSAQKSTRLISEAEHIHNKMVFDCLNEALDVKRPYGWQGPPQQWSRKVRTLKPNIHTNQDDPLVQIKEQVLCWSEIKAGKLPDHTIWDEDQLQLIREERLAALLAQEVVEMEPYWVDYENEETQIKLDLADMLLEHLAEEVVILLNNIHNNV